MTTILCVGGVSRGWLRKSVGVVVVEVGVGPVEHKAVGEVRSYYVVVMIAPRETLWQSATRSPRVRVPRQRQRIAMMALMGVVVEIPGRALIVGLPNPLKAKSLFALILLAFYSYTYSYTCSPHFPVLVLTILLLLPTERPSESFFYLKKPSPPSESSHLTGTTLADPRPDSSPLPSTQVTLTSRHDF